MPSEQLQLAMKILIVDDEDDVRDVASMCLGLIHGFEVITASGGEEGIALAIELNPDVILLDLMMPVVDGTETMARLRANPATREIPIIFLTVKNIDSEIDRLMELGALAVMRKPFEPMTIGDQIVEILKAAEGRSARNPHEPRQY